MKVDADFTGISSSFEALAIDTPYRFKLIEIQDQKDDEDWKKKNVGNDKNPALVFISEVVEGERIGAQHRDYVYTKQKDGKVNKVGLGRIKGYAEAILGQEAANSTTGIDTDELLQCEFIGVMKGRNYVDKDTKEQKTSIELAKIMPVG